MTGWVRGGIALTALAAVLIQYTTFISGTGDGVAIATLRYFSYFTITTNCLVAVGWGAAAFAPQSALGQFFLKDTIRTAVTSYIVLVGVIYHALLASIHDPQGIEWYANHLLHTIVPLAVFLEWLLLSGERTTGFGHIISWQVYPVVYTAYTLIKGSITGFYPYPFLDVNALGYGGVAIQLVGLILTFVIASAIFVGIGKLQVRLMR